MNTEDTVVKRRIYPTRILKGWDRITAMYILNGKLPECLRKTQINLLLEKYPKIYFGINKGLDMRIYIKLRQQRNELKTLILLTFLACKTNNLPKDCTQIIVEKVIQQYKDTHLFYKRGQVLLGSSVYF